MEIDDGDQGHGQEVHELGRELQDESSSLLALEYKKYDVRL